MKSLVSWIVKGTLCAILLVSANFVSAQEGGGISQKQQEKRLSQKAKEDEKLKKKADKDNRRRHLSIQSKDVRKRMKKNTKRSDRKGSGSHRDPFYQRWFKARK